MSQSTALAPIQQVREELLPLKVEFGTMLPAHITADKFLEVIVTAVERDPALMLADRASLLIAAKEAANDGLLPDKKEGAFVVFNTKKKVPGRQGSNPNIKPVDVEVTVPSVKWMPMIYGIRKKMFQTDKVVDIQVELVHEHDFYQREAGDDATIIHRPLDFGDRGKVKGGYAIIKTKDGGVYREVMSLEQILAVAKIAKTDTVWNGPFREEMMRKTILRRLAKQVPLSAEVERVVSRDDSMYDLDRSRGLSETRLAALGESRHARVREMSASDMLSDEPIGDGSALDGEAGGGGPAVAESRPDGEGDPKLTAVVAAITAAKSAPDLLVAVEQAIAYVDDGSRLSKEEFDWLDEATVKALADLKIPYTKGEDNFISAIERWIEAHPPRVKGQRKARAPKAVAKKAGPEQAAEPGAAGPGAAPEPGAVDSDAPAAGESVDSAAAEAAAAHPKPNGILNSAKGRQEWEDPDLWVSDMLNKMSTVAGAPAKAFWHANVAFVEFARDHGYPDQAAKILKVALDRGLYQAP